MLTNGINQSFSGNMVSILRPSILFCNKVASIGESRTDTRGFQRGKHPEMVETPHNYG